ncbi:glycoside hydrolase family 18 protein [Caedibacter taeniospiralis]|uniref:glycoside hydrolase family 18 protein n=1 Tax=Caedibacter taeniospiralis TaxID=28907 RepID=UPI0037C06EA8
MNAVSLNFGSDLGESYCFALSDSSNYGDKLTFTAEDFCLTQVGSTQAVTISAPKDVMQTQTHSLHISQTKQNPTVDDVELPLALSIEVTPLIVENLAVTASNVPAKMYAQTDKTISVSLDKADPEDQGALVGEYCFDLSDNTSATQTLSFSPSTVCFDNYQLGTSQNVVITAPSVSADEEHYLSFKQSRGDITVSLPNYDPVMVAPVTKPKLIGYFTNYGVYANNACVGGDGAPGKAIPFVSYPFPRQNYTIDGAPVFEPESDTKCTQTAILQSEALGNTDLVNKLKSGKLTGVAYSFLFVYDDPANLPSGALAGQIRFTDSWSDLQASDNEWCKANDLNLRICTNNSALTTASDFTWVTKYGNFGAFANLDQYAPDVDKIVSIRGWEATNWNVYQTGDSSTDTQRINNLVDSVSALAKQFNITEVDLDVEEDGKTTNFNDFLAGNLAKIINRLHTEVTTQAGKQLKVSLTIQANPKYINALKSSVLSAENIDNLESLNLMTYDFTVPGISGYTGFNQVLFQPDAGTGQAPNEFTIDYAVQAAKQAMPGNEHKINMGLAAYTRALNGYDNPDIVNNNGFGNPYNSSNTKLLGGDNDTASCSTELGLWNSCASSFNHRYFHQFSGQGTTHDFTQVKNGETYHVGSTLIVSNFNPPQPQGAFGYSTASIAPKWDVYYTRNSVFFYTSGLDAFDYGRYSAEQGIGGAIMWTIDGDVPVSDTTNSLIVNYYDGYMKAQE